MTYLRYKNKTISNNIIIECDSKITFPEVSSNIKEILNKKNKTYFRKENLFLNIDKFYSYKGKLHKEQSTEQYFIIFFRNEEEFFDMLVNENIDIEELNKKDIFFVYVVSNNIRRVNDIEEYKYFHHIYIDKYNINQIYLEGIDLLDKSGFQYLSDFTKMDIIKNFDLDNETVDKLQFTGIISNELKEWYKKEHMTKKSNSLSKFKNKLMTIF